QLIHVNNAAKNQAKHIGVNHEYCILYAKNKENLKETVWEVPKNNINEFVKRANFLTKSGLEFEEIEKELKELVKYPRFYDFDHYFYIDEKGVYRTDNPGGVPNGNLDTEIIHPAT